MSRKIIVDIGNTRIKYADLEEFTLTNSYQITPTKDINELISTWTNQEIEQIFISNVADIDILNLKNKLSHIEVIEIKGTTPSPLKMEYKTPETLGPDRFLAAIGAYSEFKGQPILLVDFGTCIKYEVITTDAKYLGGAISPGLEMRFKAMNTFTGKLPLMESQIPQENILAYGTSTNESMYTGVLQGIIGELKQFIAQHPEHNEKLCIIFSGGYAQEFANYLENHIFVRPNLVLTGLVHIIRYNEY